MHPIQPRNILIVYDGFPTRATLLDGLYSFRRYSDAKVFYLNLHLKRVPWYVSKVDFDLVLFHTLFFPSRWDSMGFRRLIKKVSALAETDAVKAMLPQDEFINAEVVNEFINALGIDIIFSVQPDYEWPSIYRTIDRSRVRIYRVLTGYLDDTRVEKINRLRNSSGNRPIDIGYRTTGQPHYWFGRHGYLKRQIADVFAPKAEELGLNVDISTSSADTLLGDDWYKFLCHCKYTLGVEGGTSILDFDGSIKRKTEEYCVQNPTSTFEEIEKVCFPGLDGSFQGYAISPRHLEACAARVCQVLTEGDYNGILLPGKHYIPVKKDFSNADKVLETIKRDDLRKEITENAYQEIVESGKYSYRRFVDFVLKASIKDPAANKLRPLSLGIWTEVIYSWMRFVDLVDRLIGRVHGYFFTPLRQKLIGR